MFVNIIKGFCSTLGRVGKQLVETEYIGSGRCCFVIWWLMGYLLRELVELAAVLRLVGAMAKMMNLARMFCLSEFYEKGGDGEDVEGRGKTISTVLSEE